MNQIELEKEEIRRMHLYTAEQLQTLYCHLATFLHSALCDLLVTVKNLPLATRDDLYGVIKRTEETLQCSSAMQRKADHLQKQDNLGLWRLHMLQDPIVFKVVKPRKHRKKVQTLLDINPTVISITQPTMKNMIKTGMVKSKKETSKEEHNGTNP